MNGRLIMGVALIGAAGIFSLWPRASVAVPAEAFEGIVIAVAKDALTAMDALVPRKVTFEVKQNVRITRNGELARMDEIQPGDAVRIFVRPLGDKLLALSIEARSPRPTAPL
ncbi:MAG TPA: hypothetical protein VFV87_14530, partial [Pirellulaceae bacterium]|nr:hypothetical protein [Pirellulaceae bacterium]